MSSTYLSLHYHIVFSTKERRPSIAEDWQSRLHKYLGGTVNGLGGFTQGVGGVADHVHLLVGLRATHCLADFMRELKKAASIWVHENAQDPEFAWQERYAAFTVSPTARDAVTKYIANQTAHHRKKLFEKKSLNCSKWRGLSTTRNTWTDDPNPSLSAVFRRLPSDTQK